MRALLDDITEVVVCINIHLYVRCNFLISSALDGRDHDALVLFEVQVLAPVQLVHCVEFFGAHVLYLLLDCVGQVLYEAYFVTFFQA